MRRPPQTPPVEPLLVATIVAALLGAVAWTAHRDTAANQAAYDLASQTGTIPAAPPAISGATLTIQERL